MSLNYSLMNKRKKATKHRAEKNEHTGRFKLFLYRGIDTVHKFSCMCDAVCVHVTCAVVTLHPFCKGLELLKLCPPEISILKISRRKEVN